MDNESFLHEATKNAIKKVVRTDPLVLAKERLATVFNLRKLTNELKCQELALKDTMHPDVKRVHSVQEHPPFRARPQTAWLLGYGGCFPVEAGNSPGGVASGP